jgi:c-di-GMP-binding flagellar brake protein YcgR
LDGLLIGGPCILQPEGHGGVGICSKGGDECCLDLVFFLESDLVVTRVAVEEIELDAATCRFDDLVDAWKRERILRAVFVEISVIHTHPP